MSASVAAAGESHHHRFQARGQPRLQREEPARGQRLPRGVDVPVSFQVMYEKKKKSEGKLVRAERQVVLDMLFSAFEKHQYYNIKELVDITKQPVVSATHANTNKNGARKDHLPTLSR